MRKIWESWVSTGWRRDGSEGDVTTLCCYVMEDCKQDGARLFLVVYREEMDSNRSKL